MADRPIPFSAPMVAALLSGTKTQTRRIAKAKPGMTLADFTVNAGTDGCATKRELPPEKLAVPHTVGDRLWVRESYYQRGHWAPVDGAQTKGGRQKWGFVPADDVVAFDSPAGEVRLGRHSADPGTVCWHKRLGRFMPRSASRMTLLVTDVRVQRLRDISEKDAEAEGCELDYADGHPIWYVPGVNTGRHWPTARQMYADLWDSINGAGAWAANPWVVAYSFTVEHRNIDAQAAG